MHFDIAVTIERPPEDVFDFLVLESGWVVDTEGWSPPNKGVEPTAQAPYHARNA